MIDRGVLPQLQEVQQQDAEIQRLRGVINAWEQPGETQSLKRCRCVQPGTYRYPTVLNVRR